MKTHRILIVEDHPPLREVLAVLLDREPEFTVVGQAGSLAEARGMIRAADVAIIDPGLPDGDGLELVAEMCRVNLDCRILILTASLDRVAFARAVEAGAAGLLHKSTPIEEVIAAVRRMCAGEALLSATEVFELIGLSTMRRDQEAAARAAWQSLTPREREVIQALADGLDSHQIALRLGIAPQTERNYMTSILTKLDVSSRLQALVFVMRHGLVQLRPVSQPDSEGANG